MPTFRNAFFYICIFHLISNCVEFSLNLLWTGPATFLNLDNSVTNSFIGSRIAQIALVFWITSIYSQLQIAINRLIAIAFPMLYGRIFVGRKLLYFMSLFWVLTLCHAALFSWGKLLIKANIFISSLCWDVIR
ncbi:unnamed protein product [Cylicocyclus nassatus]|uniref:7TM GPCR serpentine receptor class x (Srx) domain-containing protein n=1 Tax=Cylicocyclus nassatus TaxID=53992 RepID=A0AA36MB57_CYLNA|nr:unnamed protein product [Cylicocyclus nassatus]